MLKKSGIAFAVADWRLRCGHWPRLLTRNSYAKRRHYALIRNKASTITRRACVAVNLGPDRALLKLASRHFSPGTWKRRTPPSRSIFGEVPKVCGSGARWAFAASEQLLERPSLERCPSWPR